MCQVLDGEWPVQIKWFKDREELNELSKMDEQVELMANDELGSSSLLFRRVQQQHGGNYTCLATNRFGSTSFSSSMSVKGKFGPLLAASASAPTSTSASAFGPETRAAGRRDLPLAGVRPSSSGAKLARSRPGLVRLTLAHKSPLLR